MGHTTKPIKEIQKLKKMSNYLRCNHPVAYIYFILATKTGYRASDLIDLTVADVKEAIEQRKFSILEKKTDSTRKNYKPRVVEIGDNTIEILSEYIKNKNSWEYIFPSPIGRKHLSIRRMGVIINNAAKECDINYCVANHGLRKTYGYMTYKRIFNEKNNDIYALLSVQEDFGHSTPEITKRYIGLYDEERKRTTDYLDTLF
ncbi:tyrosine-type recombinase/integrase [Clostridium perfringens]